MIRNNKNKKGASLIGWTEGAVGIMLLLICLGIVVVGMNLDYNQNHDSTFGMSSNTTRTAFESYQKDLKSATEGEASTNAITGVSVVSSWGAVKAGISMMFDFLNGQWIRNSIGLLQWGDAGTALGWALSLVFIFSIGFIFIKIIFKVKP